MADCALLILSAAAGGWLRQSPSAGQWAFLAMLPLLAVIRCSPPPRAALCGALWGASCLFGSTIGHGDLYLALLTSVAFVMLPALYACLAALSMRRAGFHPFVLAVGWMLVEWAMTRFSPGLTFLTSTVTADGTLSDFLRRSLGFVLLSFVWALIDAVLLTVLWAVVQRVGAVHISWPRRIRHSIHPFRSAEPVAWWWVQPGQPRAPPMTKST